jgi:nucleoside phosphorylase
MAMLRRRAVIITALPIEQKAVSEHLRDIQEETHPQGSVYRRAIFDDNSEPWDILLAEIGAGNEGAAAEVERAITHFDPQVAIFVGVAGAVKDLSHGDVVASTKIYNYDSGKDKTSHFETRPDIELPGYSLLSRPVMKLVRRTG